MRLILNPIEYEVFNKKIQGNMYNVLQGFIYFVIYGEWFLGVEVNIKIT